MRRRPSPNLIERLNPRLAPNRFGPVIVSRPASPKAPDGGMADGGMAETEAQAPSNTLNISNDAANLIAKKPPKAITLREDGLFELSYDDGNYLVDPDGKLVRKEPPTPAPAKK